MLKNPRLSIACSFLTVSLAALAPAEDFSIDWHTIDGGDGYSAGGAFELEGGF